MACAQHRCDERSTIVVAIRCAYDGVDVEGHCGVVGEKIAAVMIEFENDDRVLDAEIERASGLQTADPGGPGIIEMVMNFGNSDRAPAGRHERVELVDEVNECGFGEIGKLTIAHSLEGDDAVVLESIGQVTFVATVYPSVGHRGIDHVLVNLALAFG